ncbi:hypothetical protein IP68_02325 [Blastomonas sp. AAP25]|uniref:hypothetical protein n=1 Tax=Blastomonas sp. AAP25 TaxID=1523416 RepID=UPI0006B8841A|nr:hypothetical protein [Blastomonas sp. AAP25]KPF76751.1 hypothetical protein IP68_02325 [Blastomonas sp. AAP25]
MAGGAQPINLSADQARVIHWSGVSQIRLRPGVMADRIVAGSQAWIREPYAFMPWADNYAPTAALARADSVATPGSGNIHFLADGRKPAGFGITRFARTLPRQMSRGFLQVLSIEIDELQRWSLQDEAALGFSKADYVASWNVAAAAIASFGGDSRGMLWADNPRVRIINFRLVRQNIDAWLASRREGVAHRKLAAAVPETAAASSARKGRQASRSAPSATNATGHERT